MYRAAAALIGVLLAGTAIGSEPEAAPDATAQEEASSPAAVAPFSAPYTRIELRRQSTDRGTPDETSRTTLRLEQYFLGTAVSRVRLDLPFPDEKTDFAGDPFSPRPGDLKVRADFRRFQVGSTLMSSDIELIFPTADPSSLGMGKYQVTAALHSVPGPGDVVFGSGRHQVRFEWNLRQSLSVAGDPDRKDVNNTKPELALRDTIDRGRHWLKLTLKPTIDWIQDGKTGAVLELEAGWNASRNWRFSIMGGARAWGEGVPGTYNRRLELVAGRAF